MVKKRHPATLEFECLTFKQADQVLILFFCSAKTLWMVTEVNQRKEHGNKRYQRAVSPARVAKIAEFIDCGNFIPTSVLISFKHAKLSSNKKKLVIENRQDAGWVIDGQHRLAGGNESTGDITLPVVAFTDLSVQGQINCFVTINKEQKGVSSSLYLELLKNLPGTRNPNEDAKTRAVDLAHMVRQEDDSPFFGKIVSTTSPGRGEISLTNFVRKVHPMLKGNTGCLTAYTEFERAKILGAYYKALKQVFPEEYNNPNSVFFKTIGFGALMGGLSTFLNITLSEQGGFRVSHAAKTFARIADFDFSEWRRFSGSGAESAATEALVAELKKHKLAGSSSEAIELD